MLLLSEAESVDSVQYTQFNVKNVKGFNKAAKQTQMEAVTPSQTKVYFNSPTCPSPKLPVWLQMNSIKSQTTYWERQSCPDHVLSLFSFS